jgi:hypothetical protein
LISWCLANGRISVGDAKTEAGIRLVDILPADAGFTLRVYAHAMRRDEGDKDRLKALVKRRDWAPLGTTVGQTPPADARADGPEDDETPRMQGLQRMGAAGFEPATSRV